MPSCAVLIPAYNEASHVAEVVRVALAAYETVLVVDDGSSDATASVAQGAGATVLQLPQNRGKGGAVYAGATRLQSDVIVLLDADLTGLTLEHVRALAEPVLTGRVVMTRGVFAGGRWRTTAAQRLTPQLNGQRGIVRERLLEVEGLAESRYGIEIAITDYAKRAQWPVLDVPLRGVSQIMKEEKRGFLRGVGVRLGMYKDILRELVRNLSRRQGPR